MSRIVMGQIRETIEAGVATLVLDNAPANSVSLEMARALRDAVARIRDDRTIGALMITGAGEKTFCAGSDIGDLQRLTESGEGASALLAIENEACDALAALDIPLIAAVNGAAIGGGLEIAACCDLIFAAEEASFALPEIKLGVFPAVGGTVRIPRRIGPGHAMDMMLTGRRIKADEAMRWGLVDRLLPRAALLAETQSLARTLAAGPRTAIAALKQAMRLSATRPADEALRETRRLAAAHDASADAKEGLRAFLAGETPDFSKTR